MRSRCKRSAASAFRGPRGGPDRCSREPPAAGSCGWIGLGGFGRARAGSLRTPARLPVELPRLSLSKSFDHKARACRGVRYRFAFDARKLDFLQIAQGNDRRLAVVHHRFKRQGIWQAPRRVAFGVRLEPGRRSRHVRSTDKGHPEYKNSRGPQGDRRARLDHFGEGLLPDVFVLVRKLYHQPADSFVVASVADRPRLGRCYRAAN